MLDIDNKTIEWPDKYDDEKIDIHSKRISDLFNINLKKKKIGDHSVVMKITLGLLKTNSLIRLLL